MNRTPEPEVMDGLDQSLAYAKADFSEVNDGFVAGFLTSFQVIKGAHILDLGCGPADIPCRLLALRPDLLITGVDGSAPMLSLARNRKEHEGLRRLELVEATLPLPCPVAPYDIILSNSLLHHLHDPSLLWDEIKRQGRPGTQIYIMDLLRPESEQMAHDIVHTYASNEPAILRKDFFHSLLAAFRVPELHTQLKASGLSRLQVEQMSDRHVCIKGVL
jgi:ubiquinone/menaquinone biosynthesis C-methylase UbiE